MGLISRVSSRTYRARRPREYESYERTVSVFSSEDCFGRPEMTEPRIYFVYGSETGKSQAVAEDLYSIFMEIEDSEKCPSDVKPLNDCLDLVFDNDKPLYLGIAISSTGNGDPPVNAKKFINKFAELVPEQKCLSQIYFKLLGLGDSTYSTFHAVPKKLRELLLSNGAAEFGKFRLADDFEEKTYDEI